MSKSKKTTTATAAEAVTYSVTVQQVLDYLNQEAIEAAGNTSFSHYQRGRYDALLAAVKFINKGATVSKAANTGPTYEDIRRDLETAVGDRFDLERKLKAAEENGKVLADMLGKSDAELVAIKAAEDGTLAMLDKAVRFGRRAWKELEDRRRAYANQAVESERLVVTGPAACGRRARRAVTYASGASSALRDLLDNLRDEYKQLPSKAADKGEE